MFRTNEMMNAVDLLFQNIPVTLNNIPNYARDDKGEVDMVVMNQSKSKPQWPIEIKWSNKSFMRIEELKSMVSFCKKSNLSEAIVTTYDVTGEKDVNGIQMHYIPSAVYAYNVGARTIQHRYLDVLT